MLSPAWTQSSFGKKASAWLPRLGLSAPTLTCHWACTNCGMIKADSASVQRNIAEILIFFSSRRRHTRWPRDWSSDVCSSDLLSRRIFWSEQGRDRHYLLGALFQLLDEEGWRYSTDTGWNEWDIQIYGNFWWSVALHTVTEYHGAGKCLTRVRLRDRLVTTTVIFNLIALALLVYRQLNISHLDLWSIIPYGLFVLFLATRARALKSRVAEVVDLAALRTGLQRVLCKSKIAASAPAPYVRLAVNAI